MASKTSISPTELPSDVLSLIFEQLVGESATLASIGLTSRAWRCLSLPFILRIVDLSSHNRGRLPDEEDDVVRPRVYGDYSDCYRQKNLVPRQRAFLRHMTNKPALAKHIHSLTWTLIWRDFHEDGNISDINLETWNVFHRMNNVSTLDLASLQQEISEEPIVRQNPSKLFAKVRKLRLVGWMHRGLVNAIITSLDPSRLRSIALDYLDDEGALPNGCPMPYEVAKDNALSAKNSGALHLSDNVDHIDARLSHRQAVGMACIFPGPMWLPLALLSPLPLDSLTNLQVKLAPFDEELDLRNYHTLFQATAEVMLRAQGTLQSLVIFLGQCRPFYPGHYQSTCGTSSAMFESRYRPECINIAAAFLRRLVSVLSKGSFPRLTNIEMEGFDILEMANDWEKEASKLDQLSQAIRDCPFAYIDFTSKSHIDDRDAFTGYDYANNDPQYDICPRVLMNS